MTIAAGKQAGPYQIIASLGAGGMGEVYRARDTRLGRDVAIKILPAAFASDADRLRRFEQEARATAALNHPNILAVFDVGSLDGSPYVVSELLEGETLRERLRNGPLSQRKAIEFATQIGNGLAAAHEKGILHRDLKPENLFITSDERVKILDFGLAKLVEPQLPSHSAATAGAETDAGTVLGTMGYMSPEQVRGIAVDARTDIFSFGAVLYEMLSGRRAFHGATSADTISAILKEDPPELSETNRNISPALERIVRHCLEKSQERRFQSARDLAFDLESLSATSASAITRTPVVDRRRARLALLIAAGVIAIAIAFVAGRVTTSNAGNAAPAIQQLTFRAGSVGNARFAPDGRTIVYSAAWEGKPEEIFTTSDQGPGSRSLDLKDASLLAISSTGQMAIKLNPTFRGPFARLGTLAVVPISGGAPRELLESVDEADYSPDGSQMAVVQIVNGHFSLQYPVGKVLFTSPLWISHPRISPDGDRVAFLNHPFGGDEGSVMVADRSGKVKELSKGWLSLDGLAWSANGKEIWFTGTRVGSNRALYAVSLSGKERPLARMTGMLTLRDISAEGRVLISQAYARQAVMVMLPGAKEERDLSWFDYSSPAGISADGKLLLLFESGEGGGANYTIYLRPTDGSPAIRLGEGEGCDLSPDGKLALTRTFGNPSKLFLLPTAIGSPREIPTGNVDPGCGRFISDSRIAAPGSEPGHASRLYVIDVDKNSPPRAVSPEGTFGGPFFIVSPGGKFAFPIEDAQPMRYPLDGGPPQAIHGIQLGERVAGSDAEGRMLYIAPNSSGAARKIYKLDSVTGKRQFWKELGPADRAGVSVIHVSYISPDGKRYVYVYERALSQLYLFTGLR